MKTKILALAFIASLLSFTASHSQQYAFRVLVNKGKNEVKAGETWQAIKVGTNLKATDELRVTENAYMGLVHATGKPLEVKKAGKYKVADLATKVSGGSSVVNKYTDFIISSNTTKKNNLAATGAVDRGTDFLLHMPLPAQQPHIYGEKIILSWEEDKTASPYIVSFRSLFEDELAKIETEESQLTVDLTASTLANEDNIVVQVYSKANPAKKSRTYNLRRLSKADRERLGNALNQISQPLNEETALNKLLLASFFEENNLLIDAATAHLEAIELAPDVPAFQEGFNAFLLRNGLKASPKK